MLRNLFILTLVLGFVFVLYSMTAQNANACAFECTLECNVLPSCECAYGNDNHTKPTECIPNVDAPGGGPGPGVYGPFGVTPDCGNNETGIVTPAEIFRNGQMTSDLCRWRCSCAI